MREGCQISLSYASSLPMGWALKCPRTRSTRFSTKQKEYLTAKFQIGERSGQKADPATVSKAMRIAKDANREWLFDSTEFLTTRQIASFFSRLAVKRSIEDDGQSSIWTSNASCSKSELRSWPTSQFSMPTQLCTMHTTSAIWLKTQSFRRSL